MERCVSQLEVANLAGKKVQVELFALTDEAPFAQAYTTAWLKKHGIRIVKNQEDAEITFKVFATALGVDQSTTLLGTPAFQVLGVPIPEIALYKSVRNRGLTEMQMFVFDGESGKFLKQIPKSTGKAKYDNLTVLIFISFSLNDLEKRSK